MTDMSYTYCHLITLMDSTQIFYSQYFNQKNQ